MCAVNFVAGSDTLQCQTMNFIRIRRAWCSSVHVGGIVLFVAAYTAAALDLKEMQAQPDLTPKRFMELFKDFEFKFHARLQEPDEFLLNRSGDCDDFAVVGDLVLHPRGYDTRLIGIRMPGLAHMVCYVIDDKVYLDYNKRDCFLNLPRSDASIRVIAGKVAKSLKSNWTSASEYVLLGKGQLQAVSTVVKTNPADRDPVFGRRPEDIHPSF